MNKTILIGNMTRDIELHYTQAGVAIGKTGLAVTRKYTSNGEKKEEVMFIDIVYFGRSAEVANQYTRKGSKVAIEGRLTLEQWTDQNGQKRSKHSVTVENMQMLDSKPQTGGQPQYEHQQVNRGSTADAGRGMPDVPEQTSIDEYDGVPF